MVHPKPFKYHGFRLHLSFYVSNYFSFCLTLEFNSWIWFLLESNQSILKEISPKYSLEGLMLKLKLQYFGHLMWRTDSLERPWYWERLKVGGEGDDRGWDGWMAPPPTRWAWVWANSGSWWWTGKPDMLWSMGHKESDTTERVKWTEVLKRMRN